MAERPQAGAIWRAPLLAWGGLCLLLLATVALAFVPMGRANLPVSLAIAAVKAALVGSVFMRLSARDSLNRLAASTGFVWLFIMFLLLGADYFTR